VTHCSPQLQEIINVKLSFHELANEKGFFMELKGF
jgi:hypothetical protein